MPPIPPPYDRTPPTGPGLDNKTRAALQVAQIEGIQSRAQ